MTKTETTLTASKFKNEAEKISEFEKMFDDIAGNKIPFERQWLTNTAFYHGKHYVSWVNTSNSQRMLETPAPSHRVRLVINKCKVVVRTEVSKLLKERPRGYVIPNTSDDIDKAAARQASRLYESLEKPGALNVQAKMRLGVFWMSLLGNGFIKVYYDPDSEDFTGTLGAIKVDTRNSYNIYVPDLLEPDIECQPYVIDVCSKTTDWIKDTFGVTVNADSSTDMAGQSGRMLSSMGLTTEKVTSNKVTVKEIWIKPCSKYPTGMMAVWVRDKLLVYNEGWPYKHGQYPYAKLDHIPTGGFFTSSTLVDLIPLQKEYNRSISQIIESRNLMSKPQWVVQKGSIDVGKITSQPGLIIEYLMGTQPPKTEAPPPIPGYLSDLINRVQSDMNDVSSQHEVTKGSTPPGVTAATAISFLQEEDDSKLSLTITSIEEATQKIAGQILSLVSQFWSVPRQVKLVGNSNFHEIKAFKGSTLRGNTDYRVEFGSASPRSRSAKQAFILELMANQHISSEQGLKYLDMEETASFYDETQLDARQAEKENFLIMDGDTNIEIHDWDEDIKHIIAHENFMKTEQFDLLDETVRNVLIDHVKAHKVHLASMYGRYDLLPTPLIDPRTQQNILDEKTGKPRLTPDNPMLEGFIETIKLQGPPPIPPAPPPPGMIPGELPPPTTPVGENGIAN